MKFQETKGKEGGHLHLDLGGGGVGAQVTPSKGQNRRLAGRAKTSIKVVESYFN